MNDHPDIVPDPRPYDLGTGEETIGVLLVHSFTGSPTETRPLAEFIRAATGWRCKGILLPGHGTRIEDLEQTPIQDWVTEVVSGCRELATHCNQIFLAGTSMGAVICCHAALNPTCRSKLSGMILMAPSFALPRRVAMALPFVKYLLRREYKGNRTVEYFRQKGLFSYSQIPIKKAVEGMRMGKEALQQLDRLKGTPILMLAGTYDRTVCLSQIRKTAEEKPWIRFLELPASRHILTVEPDQQTLFEECLRFMRECLQDKNARKVNLASQA